MRMMPPIVIRQPGTVRITRQSDCHLQVDDCEASERDSNLT
jgi:hypothetical protein